MGVESGGTEGPWASKAGGGGGTGDAFHAVEKSAWDVPPEMMLF